MKIRYFTIRDLLWLTALCAVLVAWWMDHRRLVDMWEAMNEPVFFSGVATHQ
jgi:hypothetical protein